MVGSDYVYLDVEKMSALFYYLEDITRSLHELAQESMYASRQLQWSWEGSGADELIRQITYWWQALEDQAQQLRHLVRIGKKEINEWISVDVAFSKRFKHFRGLGGETYLSIYKDTFIYGEDFSQDDIITIAREHKYTRSIIADIISKIKDYADISEKLMSAAFLVTHLRWSPLRPNSIIFTGPNWMRKSLNIKAATRVIRPSTLGKNLAIIGALESLREGAITSYSTFTAEIDEGYAFSHALSAAAIDGLAKFSITAVVNVGLPLALTAVVGSVGLPVLAAGGIVLGGSVIGSILYSHFIEPKLWNAWQHLSIRSSLITTGEQIVDSTIDTGKQIIDHTTNFIKDEAKKVEEAIIGPVHAISSLLT